MRYFRKTRLYEFLNNYGDISKAMKYADKLSMLSESSPEDRIAYSQMHRVLGLLGQWAGEINSENDIKSDNSDRIGNVESKIVDFLRNSSDSDVKTISKAIGLRPSRTADYLRRLVENNQIECSGKWRKIYHVK